mgnify:CR=1 FL=1
MKVAIVHFVLLYMSGAEKVLEALCELYPDADIFTHVYKPEKISSFIRSHNIQTTFINKLPGAAEYYQYYLPLMPYALEQLDLSEYDLIISGESGPTKGIVPGPDSFHICYCHSPMRYVWDMYHEYTDRKSMFLKPPLAYFVHKLKIWDHSTASRVDTFVANSSFISRRIKKYYRRESIIISPPVNTEEFKSADNIGDYYLWLGRFIQYKRPDLAIDAFNKMGKKLVMIGEGEELADCKARALNNIEFLGFQPIEVVKEMLAGSRALIFPGIEDAGITPVESMASGRPVIAYNKGGIQDTVIDGKTGVLFNEQTSISLQEAVVEFETNIDDFNPTLIVKHAQQFSKDHFKKSFEKIVQEELNKYCIT